MAQLGVTSARIVPTPPAWSAALSQFGIICCRVFLFLFISAVIPWILKVYSRISVVIGVCACLMGLCLYLMLTCLQGVSDRERLGF